VSWEIRDWPSTTPGAAVETRRTGAEGARRGSELATNLFSMRVLPLLLGTIQIAAVVGIGCSAADEARDPASATASGSAADSSAAVSAPPVWYSRVRTLDLTRDGRADSVHLQAVGARPDSLRISLSFFVAGEQKHREAWGSSYELALVDSAARWSPRVDTVLRARLDSVLASVVVEDLDAPGVRLMAEDRAVIAGLEPRPTQRVSFSYGYESTTRLVWDSPRERFVRLWSCC